VAFILISVIKGLSLAGLEFENEAYKETVNCGVSISPIENLSVSANLFYKDKILPGAAV
jgi:hypothetical protein